jgi:hypothetical protein
MEIAYENQSALEINVETGQLNDDLVAALVKQIEWIDPTGNSGKWDATISGSKLTYNMTNTGTVENPTSQFKYGRWVFSSSVVFSDGTWAPGDAVEVFIYKKGQIIV